ncbi:hypothetical protein DRO69_03050 [Candidatus Bathyarchaeota archaeon]|nr:MAG: hypothetical protein DRO69_03050 [Candidatus Bathyarchaeota archaeon]
MLCLGATCLQLRLPSFALVRLQKQANRRKVKDIEQFQQTLILNPHAHQKSRKHTQKIKTKFFPVIHK